MKIFWMIPFIIFFTACNNDINARNNMEELIEQSYEQLIEREVARIQLNLLKQAIVNRNDNHLDVSEQDERCLARNIFFEAGTESYEGKLGVAQVTWNRVETGRWGNTICEVVKARAQFSWTLKKKMKPPAGPLWEESKRAAREFIEWKRVPELEGSLHYHATYVNPHWNRDMIQVAMIGRHIFYDR